MYKKDDLGRIRTWEIHVEGSSVCTSHGVLGGAMQEDRYTIYNGTNVGKSNERPPEEQAEFEANKKWKDMWQKKGYFRTLEEAQNATGLKVTSFGGIKPMKAQKYDDFKHKLVYPLMVQPKLDGHRCIATCIDDKIKLWASGGKQILNCAHIEHDLREYIRIRPATDEEMILDGELYAHGMPLNEISAIARTTKNLYDNDLEFHVFDTVEDKPYKDRCVPSFSSKYIKNVRSEIVVNSEHADVLYKNFVADGYEGIIYRNMGLRYEQKRSYDMLKRKDFQEEDFFIIGINEGKGRDEGTVASFICENSLGGTFDCRIRGTYEYRRNLFKPENKWRWQNKWLTVRYLQKWAEVPQIPIGIVIRDQEGVD